MGDRSAHGLVVPRTPHPFLDAQLGLIVQHQFVAHAVELEGLGQGVAGVRFGRLQRSGELCAGPLLLLVCLLLARRREVLEMQAQERLRAPEYAPL